ncbi:hypothetical protein [Tunturiibacter gelidiferens]|uniref:hypothetical protein n=1 Tax=Tunturiibacter gelidiferens TaxID=3069689 RepID=UPI003D9B3875
MNKTYIKVKGPEKYLDRAVDSSGLTADFLLNSLSSTDAQRGYRHAIDDHDNFEND